MSPALQKAFKTFVESNKIPESTEYGSLFLSYKLSFTEGWNAAKDYLYTENEERKEKKNQMEVYRYYVNSEIKEYSEPLYWYKWTRGGGHTPFASAYTEKAFLAKVTLSEFESPDYPFTNISREPLPQAE